MHWRQMMESNYLGAWDLMNDDGTTFEKIVTITKVEKGEVVSAAGKARKPIVHFEGAPKPMVFNVTNCKSTGRLYGNDPTKWKGKKVTLYVGEAQSGGETVPALRVRPQAPNGKANDAREPGGEG